MIPQIPTTKQNSKWQKELQSGIANAQALLDYLNLSAYQNQISTEIEKTFPSRIPLAFARRMKKGDIHDPLLKQVLAVQNELMAVPGFEKDPLQEKKATLLPGLIHKYTSRVLITLSGTCAINCRFCFRRHFPYQDNNPGRQGWEKIWDYLAEHNEINEIILSGGDPLIVPDKTFFDFTTKALSLPSIKRLRIHSRIPIVLPSRLTSHFIQKLGALGKACVLVIHCNHAQEIDEIVHKKIKALKKVGVTVLNQAVLLKGVNDTPQALIDLSEKLFEIGVLPYYLHQLDPVEGTSHFAVSLEEGKNLMREITTILPGYLVPKWVAEYPDYQAKQSLFYEIKSTATIKNSN